VVGDVPGSKIGVGGAGRRLDLRPGDLAVGVARVVGWLQAIARRRTQDERHRPRALDLQPLALGPQDASLRHGPQPSGVGHPIATHAIGHDAFHDEAVGAIGPGAVPLRARQPYLEGEPRRRVRREARDDGLVGMAREHLPTVLMASAAVRGSGDARRQIELPAVVHRIALLGEAQVKVAEGLEAPVGPLGSVAAA